MNHKLFVGFIGFLMVSGMAAETATITVSQDGAGMVDNVQTALAIASAGDEIVILDSAVYEEDVIGGAGAGFAGSFTLRAAEGQNPSIVAQNTAERLVALGIPGPDYGGAMFFGCQGVLIEGITFINPNTEVDALGFAGALSILDSFGITVRDCTIRGAGGEGVSYAGNNVGVLIAGVMAAPADILVENCLMEECHIGLATGKLQLGTPTDPTVTVRGCLVQNCNSTGLEADSGSVPGNTDPTGTAGPGNLFEDNTVINCNVGIMFSGGHGIARRCTVLASRGRGLEVDLDDTRGTRPISGIVEDCYFIGSGDDGVQVDEGFIELSRCIIAGSGNEGIHVRNQELESRLAVDHCDLYYNNQNQTTYEIHVDPTTSELIQLILTNTNVVGFYGIYNGDLTLADSFDEEALFANYCNVFVEDERYVNVAVTEDRNFDPLYISPTADPYTFDPAGFAIANDSPIKNLADDGSAIGSQGVQPVCVDAWMVY